MMENKKIFYIGIIIIFTMVLIISFASAKHNIFHFWGKKPELAPFNATATIQGVAPIIPIVVNVSDDFASSAIDYIQVTEGGVSNVTVIFLADDENSNANLRSGSLTIGTDVTIAIYYAGTKPATLAATPVFAGVGDSCIEVGCNPTYCGVAGIGSGIASNQRMYKCTWDAMQFYFEPNVDNPIPNLWIVNITIFDLDGQTGRNDTKNFTYLQTPSVENIVNLTWFGLDPAGTAQTATNNVTMLNKGNKLITQVGIISYNMTGASYTPGSGPPHKYIPASTVRSDGTLGLECGLSATTLRENAEVVVNGTSLDYGPSVSADLLFCIFPQLSLVTPTLDLSDSPYTAVGTSYATAGTADWQLVNEA